MLVKQAPNTSGPRGVSGAMRRQQPHTSIPVRDWFLTVPIAKLDGINVPANSGDYSLRRDAVKWMAEVQTARWVCEENFARGVSPGSATVAHKFAEFVGVLGDGPSTEALLRSADSDSREDGRTLRSWAAGFRARWGIGTNHMACLDVPPVEALGSIARHSGLRYSPRIRLPNESRNPRLDRSFLCPALFLGVQI